MHMRLIPLAFVFSMSSVAWAADPEGSAVTGVHNDDIRLLGRLNVNVASREELLEIPSIDAAAVERIIAARSHGKLNSLSHLELSEEACRRLVIEGPSTLRRIRQLPLEVYSQAPAAASR